MAFEFDLGAKAAQLTRMALGRRVQRGSPHVLEAHVKFTAGEVPVAYSMVAMALDHTGQARHPLHAFTCYWTAFNNIYVTAAERLDRRVELRMNPDGSIQRRVVGRVRVPQVNPVRERDQIDLAFHQFPEELRQRLLDHPSVRYFVYRTPSWRGRLIESDGDGQPLNGILNVGYTVDATHPVWTPIDTELFEAYDGGEREGGVRDILARQILDVLYTIRNNAVHAGKRADDADDQEVLEMALPLLAMIVDSFLSDREAA